MSEAISEVVERLGREVRPDRNWSTVQTGDLRALLNYIKARPSREEVARAVRKAMIDKIERPEVAQSYDLDLLLLACDKAGYFDPEDAAEQTAEMVADAVLSLFSSTSQPDHAPGEGGWLPIESAPTDDTMFLAATADGRMMIWCGSILATARSTKTPGHLQFPATHWMPLPALPQPQTEGGAA